MRVGMEAPRRRFELVIPDVGLKEIKEMDIFAEAILSAFSEYCKGVKLTAICPACGKTLIAGSEGTRRVIKCPNGCIKETLYGI